MSFPVRLSLVSVAGVMAVSVFSGCAQSSNSASSPPGAQVHVRGEIASVTPSALTITTDHGAESVAISSSTKVAGVVPATASAIKPNTFIGTANVPGANAARALEVVVFPASMRGTGEGNYAWDSPANAKSSSMTNGTVSGSSMTNGTVSESSMTNGTVSESSMTNGTVSHSSMTNGTVSHSSMTNGTVSQSSKPGGLVLTVNYGDGSKQITVPPNAPIVRIKPGSRSLLVEGAHVFVAAKNVDGHLVAARIIAGENGTVPPM